MNINNDIRRWELIQKLIDKNNFKKYLEIGVSDGYTLQRIKCKNKIGVDPKNCITLKSKIKAIIKNITNLNIKFFEQTSDDFFLKNENFLKKINGIDISLIDGLHTFEASLKDVLNTLKYLNKNGYIIMHDCFPPNDGAALETKDMPTPEEVKMAKVWTNAWCGDVWKTIVYLRKVYNNELEVFVYDSDYGLGVVKFKSEIKNYTIDYNIYNDIKKLKYSDLLSDPKNLIGLTNSFFI